MGVKKKIVIKFHFSSVLILIWSLVLPLSLIVSWLLNTMILQLKRSTYESFADSKHFIDGQNPPERSI